MRDLTSVSCMFCKSETFVFAKKLAITHISMRELNTLLFLSSGSSELSVENEINLGLTQSSTQIRLVRQ